MALHKHEPWPEKRMYHKYAINTICEELRKAYKCVDRGDMEALKIHIRVAVTMAKKMNEKLKEYNEQWYKDFWDK